jgi:hypothetical protein
MTDIPPMRPHFEAIMSAVYKHARLTNAGDTAGCRQQFRVIQELFAEFEDAARSEAIKRLEEKLDMVIERLTVLETTKDDGFCKGHPFQHMMIDSYGRCNACGKLVPTNTLTTRTAVGP